MRTLNQKNPSIRRIMADVRELAHNPSDQYAARPLEDNMFDWHFVIRGPKGTDYEGGIYHGRIVLPKDYPFKPPSIMLLTPNGRWEIKQKICLSISSYHPEQWQPAWGIRTILEAIINFMVTPAEGAVGALECSPEVRKRLAKESRKYSHPLMPELPPENDNGASSVPHKTQEMYAKQVKQLHVHTLANESSPIQSADASLNSVANDKVAETNQNTQVSEEEHFQESISESSMSLSQDPVLSLSSTQKQEEKSNNLPENNQDQDDATNNVMASRMGNESIATTAHMPAGAAAQTRARRRESDTTDTFLHHLSIGLMMAIFAILYRKALQLYA
uniref:UBC core domain-containing protein n=1 Tax=Aplanochytrium stocchinoi TaxID=215587 RepID=A0A7S3LNB0_9STRA|mmetsp:Transcript_13899/g.15834  ORF Transcript_13899/g.15834 Transcript_13899/m.15834 type:complete len:332 (+) Transcript_13899:33-1028(+)